MFICDAVWNVPKCAIVKKMRTSAKLHIQWVWPFVCIGCCERILCTCSWFMRHISWRNSITENKGEGEGREGKSKCILKSVNYSFGVWCAMMYILWWIKSITLATNPYSMQWFWCHPPLFGACQILWITVEPIDMTQFTKHKLIPNKHSHWPFQPPHTKHCLLLVAKIVLTHFPFCLVNYSQNVQ